MKPVPIKVRRGQIWQKRDTGATVVITARKRGDYWLTKRIDGAKSHSLYDKDLRMFWIPVKV